MNNNYPHNSTGWIAVNPILLFLFVTRATITMLETTCNLVKAI